MNGIRILLVDDVDIICEELKSKLERLHNPDITEIFSTSNSFHALELIASIKPHIVISDILMPGMNGIELIRRSLNILDSIRFVILSGHDDYCYVREAFTLGVVDYLLKPVKIGELRVKIQFIIDDIKERKGCGKESAIDTSKNINHDSEKESTIINLIKKHIQENYHQNVNLAEVANMLKMNYSYLSNLFSEKNCMSFSRYLMKTRMEEAKRLLSDPANRVNEVAGLVGYDDQKVFSRAFKNYFGISPTHHRK